MDLSCPPRPGSKDGPFVAPITGERGEGGGGRTFSPLGLISFQA